MEDREFGEEGILKKTIWTLTSLGEVIFWSGLTIWFWDGEKAEERYSDRSSVHKYVFLCAGQRFFWFFNVLQRATICRKFLSVSIVHFRPGRNKDW